MPAYNEAAGIQMAIERVSEILKETGEDFEIVIVDDGSRDKTWQILQGLAAAHPELRALRLSRNFGKENAVCAGLDAARGQAVILLDADLQHPPEIIPQMIELWRQGYPIVEGRKRSRGTESFFSKIAAKSFYWLLGSLSDLELKGDSDFKLLDRQVLDAWKQLGERNVFFRGMAEWVGFERATVHFEVADRVAGQSTWSRLQLVGLAIQAIVSFSLMPLRLLVYVGFIFMVLASLLAIQTLYIKFTGNAVDGFATVILLILITSSLLMLGLGVIGEYIGRIYREVKFRPRYLVSHQIADGTTQTYRTGTPRRP